MRSKATRRAEASPTAVAAASAAPTSAASSSGVSEGGGGGGGAAAATASSSSSASNTAAACSCMRSASAATATRLWMATTASASVACSARSAEWTAIEAAAIWGGGGGTFECALMGLSYQRKERPPSSPEDSLCLLPTPNRPHLLVEGGGGAEVLAAGRGLLRRLQGRLLLHRSGHAGAGGCAPLRGARGLVGRGRRARHHDVRLARRH